MIKFHPSRSLRIKLALAFAIFGALISLLLSLSLFLITHNLGERLIDETLRAELTDYIARRARNPASLPPATNSIRGYVMQHAHADIEIPPALLTLDEGQHQIVLDNLPYRVAVQDQGDGRYFMLYNEIRQRHREEAFILYMTLGASLMILLSAAAGAWLAGRMVAPVTELAHRVANVHIGEQKVSISHGLGKDEIGQLALVFDDYLRRMRAFIERERNFTSDVSHELRTPLAIVQGVVELMDEDPNLQEKQKDRVARIGRANQDMIQLTSALLLMAREQNTEEEVKQTSDVCEMVHAVIEAHRHLLSPLTIIDFKRLAHPLVAAERTLFSIVVANLVKNAMIHTPSGQITVTVESGQVVVQDTGTGIHSDEIGKVFQRHFKGKGSEGSGIGLSLVKRICDRYGWETILESIEGNGTTAQLIFNRETLHAALT